MHVLVFDEDPAVGSLVVRIAAKSGSVEAAAVTSAEAFKAHLRSDPPNVVLLDLELGNTDGVEQMRVLADRHYAGALVLMSSFEARVLASAQVVGQGLGLNIENVLEKPLSVENLARPHLQHPAIHVVHVLFAFELGFVIP